ncbi:MAG: flagellar basal body L-ring protein FlgH [Alphaproteobacteria bacterium]|nr:flagellar basal body L-ring protein FlgH [Alphaproteobacteria bacterium]
MYARIGYRLQRLAGIALMAVALTGCNAMTRLSQVGEEPRLTEIRNPTQQPHYQPVSLPMPGMRPAAHHENSLWRPGARAFFKDQRATRVGDIMTIMITISDNAVLSNTTTRGRTTMEDASLGSFLGYESQLGNILPDAVDPSSLVDADSTTNSTGTGTVNRSETINLKVAAVVTQVLPNGNLVITGRQEIRINYEVRELQIDGVVRPEDITAANTVTYDKIAETRIAYGGRGHITDVQQPRYGMQLYDALFPF